MRLLLLCSALMFSLAACYENPSPVIQKVPADPKVFQGDWGGLANTPYEDGHDNVAFPVRFHSTATYVDSETYRVSGTLTFRDTQYDFSGTAEGKYNATFQPSDPPTIRPQFSPNPEPRVYIGASLMLNGTEAGDLRMENPPGSLATWYMVLHITSDTTNRSWSGTLTRM